MANSVTFPEIKTETVYAVTYLTRLPSYSLYLTYGKTDAWANDAEPTQAEISVSQVFDVWDNMIGARRLLGGDFSAVIPRYNWTSGETYIAYDDKLVNLSNTKFYVVTEDYNVYKCLANNNSQPSTIKPTYVSPFTVQKTSDGYFWKYMYTISDSEQLRFTTDQYIPVKTLEGDDGSLQWQVQQQAKSGTVEYIKILNGGSGYSNASNITVTVSGDGREFAGYVTTNGAPINAISNIIITNPGLNYNGYATVTFTDITKIPGTGAEARAILSPPGGHGSDPTHELSATSMIIDARLKYDEEGILPVTNDYRQISLLAKPHLNYPGSSIALSATTPTDADFPISFLQAVLQAYSLTCSGIGNYTQDEIVYQGTSTNRTFEGRVVSWNSTTSTLLLINIKGTPIIPQTLTGTTSLTSRVIASYTPGTLQPYTGNILYVNNLKPINRSSDQIEDFKILVKF